MKKKGALQMLRIAVVEDDAPTREKLCTLIRDHAVSKGKDLAVTPLEDGSSLLGGALSGYDIIFWTSCSRRS